MSARQQTVQLAEVILDTQAEGPGRRAALWLQGCPLHCEGCCNPEMLSFSGGRRRQVRELVHEICAVHGLEGISLLGGEPTAQASACAALAGGVKSRGLSVMLFSGYTRAGLETRAQTEPALAQLLAHTDLLVDGPYVAALTQERERWIGSSNQVLHVLSDRYQRDDPRFAAPNELEIRMEAGALCINGWPRAAASLGVKDRARGSR
ncbi:MAG: radical SAM protein [Deltaproteobacteria bacterium]|nr:radical SAM protein [Deltaproteobacteria bacterium]